ncbi:hypothetical protein D030_2629B, partial [Vibrio parahaemolyticus AQ3810]
RPDS